MGNWNLGEKGLAFAKIIWEHEPVSSRKLTELCEEKFGWKRTTTYTMLKNLCEKGIFENRNGTVVSLMSEEKFGMLRGDEILEDNFGGSLPKFIAAFTRRNKLSQKDIDELQTLIDHYNEEE